MSNRMKDIPPKIPHPVMLVISIVTAALVAWLLVIAAGWLIHGILLMAEVSR